MKRGIQLKQLNRRDLGLLGLPETVLQPSATDALGITPEPIPGEPPLTPDLVEEVRKELEDMLRLLEQVSGEDTNSSASPGTDPQEEQGAG